MDTNPLGVRRVKLFAKAGNVSVIDDVSRDYQRRMHRQITMTSLRRLKRVCKNLVYIGDDIFFGAEPRATKTD